jgi:CheB methylesterase
VKEDQVGLSGCLARRKVSGTLINVISIYPIIATANLITHFEYISGVNGKNEMKMKDHHYPSGFKTEEKR